MTPLIFLLLHAMILAYAFVGGVFLAFSDFIMRSLAKADGAAAMQSINREVYRWMVMTLFLALTPLSVLLAVYGWLQVGGGAGALMGFAGATYVFGCFGVTARFNVPMNQSLADMDVSAPETQAYWTATYLPRWTLWNSARTMACALSAASLSLALVWLALDL